MSVLGSLLLVAALLGGGYIGARYWLRQAAKASASAPPESRRSPHQVKLHRISAFVLLPPLAYSTLVKPEHFSPVLALLLSHVAIMLGLTAAHVPWRARIYLAPLVALGAVYVALLTEAWPSMLPTSVTNERLVVLAFVAVAVAASSILSILSFPVGHGERMS